MGCGRTKYRWKAHRKDILIRAHVIARGVSARTGDSMLWDRMEPAQTGKATPRSVVQVFLSAAQRATCSIAL